MIIISLYSFIVITTHKPKLNINLVLITVSYKFYTRRRDLCGRNGNDYHCWQYIQFDTILSPTIETIKVVMKNNLQKVAGSLNIRIPKSTVPTAPIPVQTA